MEIPKNFIHGAFFFVDIVGLSNPILSTDTQRTKIKKLNDLIYACNAFAVKNKEDSIILSTGDGMLICFKQGLEEPIQLAIELHEKLTQHNKQVLETEKFFIRIGCHSGHVFVVKDIYGNQNLWGPGAIIARRVMDLGDENHILITSTMADRLMEISEEYIKILHPLHDYKIKHGDVLLVYSVHDKLFGNHNTPKKNLTEYNDPIEKISENTNNINFDEILLKINLKDAETNIIKISKTFQFQNTTKLPIEEVMCQITTESKESILEIDLIVTDENGARLEFGRIPLDSDYEKNFSIKLNNSELDYSTRKYTISYTTKLKNSIFETIFSNNVDKLYVNFNYLSNDKILNPKMFLSKYVDREKILKNEFKSQRGMMTQTKWAPIINLEKNDLLRLEW